jgi:hypothetical protein
MPDTTHTARCTIRGRRFEVRRLPFLHASYDIGIDGWLIANTTKPHMVVSIIREELRIANNLHSAPSLPKRFADAIESL